MRKQRPFWMVMVLAVAWVLILNEFIGNKNSVLARALHWSPPSWWPFLLALIAGTTLGIVFQRRSGKGATPAVRGDKTVAASKRLPRRLRREQQREERRRERTTEKP